MEIGKVMVSWFLALALTGALAGATSVPKAESYLKVESIQAVDEKPDTVDVTLRNVSEVTITAWCLDISGGASDASSPFHETRREDHYAQYDAEDLSKQLGPGESTVRQLTYPGLDFSTERFENGDYSVLSIRVGCVFLDNGESFGPNGDAIESIQLRRLAELKAALRFQRDFEERVDDPLATLAWFGELEAGRREEDTRPVVMRRPPPAEIVEIREKRAYKSLAYYTAAEALWFYEERGFTPAQVLAWVASDLANATANGFQHLPESLHPEVR